MAGKGRRAAARQGELSRRRKRPQRGPSGIPTIAASPTQRNGEGMAVAVESAVDAAAPASAGHQTPSASSAAPAPVSRPSPQAAAQPRGQGRQRGERPAAYNYVGAELRRIAVLATVVLTVLVVLTVVLP